MSECGIEQFGIHFGHIGIHVEDADKSVEWYGKVLGLKPMPRRSNYKQGPFPRVGKVGQDDYQIEIYEVQGALDNNFFYYEFFEGVKHFGVRINHFREWLEYIKKLNVTILFESYESGIGKVIITDLDHILIECVQNAGFDDCETVSSSPETIDDVIKFGIRFDHVAMNVSDLEETAKWYEAYYGLEKVGEPVCRHPGEEPVHQLMYIKEDDIYLKLYEVIGAQKFNTVEMEFVKGFKHFDFAIEKRGDWIRYIKENLDPHIEVEIYNEKGGAVYLRDNNNILVESNRWSLLY